MSFKSKVIKWFNPEGENAQRSRVLRLVLFISLCLHLLAGLIFGGVVLVTTMLKEEVVFEAPPPHPDVRASQGGAQGQSSTEAA